MAAGWAGWAGPIGSLLPSTTLYSQNVGICAIFAANAPLALWQFFLISKTNKINKEQNNTIF